LGKNAYGKAPNAEGRADASIHYNSPQNHVQNLPTNKRNAQQRRSPTVAEEGDVVTNQDDMSYNGAESDGMIRHRDVIGQDSDMIDEENVTTLPPNTPLMPTDVTATNDVSNVFAKIHHANMMEIEMGKLAMEKGQSSEVRSFGERLMRDHQLADRKLMSYAEDKNIPLNRAEALTATESAKDHLNSTKLHSAPVAEFDRLFLRIMAEDHRKDVAEVSSAIDRLADPNAQSFLKKVRPILGQHESLANILLQKKKT
jgi:putative membrane protein